MEIEKSRNGLYTLTFMNKNNMDEKDILKEFNSVGNVCKIVQNFNRVFIRYKEKEEAERALLKFGKIYNVDMALNSGGHHPEGAHSYYHNSHNTNQTHSHNHSRNQHQKQSNNFTLPALLSPESSSKSRSMEKCNLPKNYTIKDINALVEEAKPVSINQLDETRVFHLKFCHIILDSIENLNYLIDKLNGFVLCGEKLIAVEARNLLEWKEKVV